MSFKSNLSPLYRGDTREFAFEFTDSAGHPVNITGHELWFTMKRNMNDADLDAVFQKKTVFPASPQSQKGEAVLTLTSAETDLIAPGIYVFDFQRVIPDNPPVVKTLMSGKITILPDITRSNGS
ncbi:MAG: hypothetical protein HQL90_14335 [Magnetococcales bacterium]|nr:hypothetical protein [Magnetococcales bacterium]